MADGSDVELVLRNCVKVETLEDPLPAVEAILQRCSHEQVGGVAPVFCRCFE